MTSSCSFSSSNLPSKPSDHLLCPLSTSVLLLLLFLYSCHIGLRCRSVRVYPTECHKYTQLVVNCPVRKQETRNKTACDHDGLSRHSDMFGAHCTQQSVVPVITLSISGQHPFIGEYTTKFLYYVTYCPYSGRCERVTHCGSLWHVQRQNRSW